MIDQRLIKLHRAAQALTEAADELAVAIRKMPLDVMTAIYLERLRTHIRQEIGDGVSPHTVAMDLNDRGFLPPVGGRWSSADVLQLKDTPND